MRAIGYFSAFPAQNGAPADRSTLSQQNDDFLAFCAAHGYEPAASFLDSGAKDEPAGLRQLLHYLHEPEKGFLTVVVANFARLGPTPPAAARAYFQITARGAGVTSIADGVLDEARLLRLWTGVQGNGRMGDRVRDAMRRRALQGQVLGRPPYGYRVGPQRRLEIVEDEATLVRYIVRLYLDEDLGVRRIAKRLNGEGLRTRRDGPWSMVTIRDLLRNRVYVGTYTRFGVRVPGSHPAIIAEKDFRTIQERMDSRRRPAVPVQRGRFLLSGLVICGENGARMIGVTRRQRWARRNGEVVRNTYRYYQSQARTNQSIGDYYTRRAGELEAEIRRHLTGDAPGAVRPAVLSAGNAEAVAAETAVAEARVRGRLQSLQRRLADLLTQAAAGHRRRDGLRDAAHAIVADYQEAEEELAALGRRTAAHVSERQRRQHQERQIERVRHEWDQLPFEEQRALLRDLIEKVIVDEDGVRTVLRP